MRVAPDEGGADAPALEMVRLRRSDVVEAWRLSRDTGWNQTEADWVRLLDHGPDSCFLFLEDGRVAGTSTLAAFGVDLAWIGMVIVDAPFRGRGLGRQILETTIREAQDRGYGVVGLDATDEGRRLYLKYGFHDVAPIDRWSGRLRRTGARVRATRLTEALFEEAIALDHAWSGCDRARLLRLLRRDRAPALAVVRDGELRGFAFLRPGLKFQHLGPLLAETEEDFQVLLDAAADALQGAPVFVDALRRDETSRHLEGSGLSIQRRLTRMTLHAPATVLSDPRLRAAVSFEWG